MPRTLPAVALLLTSVAFAQEPAKLQTTAEASKFATNARIAY